MKKLLPILILLSITLKSYAIKDSCGVTDVDSLTMTTFPWFAKNTWINNYVDSIEAPFNCTNCRFVTFSLLRTTKLIADFPLQCQAVL